MRLTKIQIKKTFKPLLIKLRNIKRENYFEYSVNYVFVIQLIVLDTFDIFESSVFWTFKYKMISKNR